MTFLEDEVSSDSSQPREYFDIVLPTITYRHASGTRDLQIGTALYTAIPVARSEIGVSSVGNIKELTLTLPADHPVVERYLTLGVPPKTIDVTVWRRQERSGVSEQIWSGRVTGLACKEDGSEATLQVSSRTTEKLRRMLPTVSVQRACVHTLYDAQCTIDRTSSLFRQITPLIYVDGRTVRLDIGDVPINRDQWSVNGELVHTASGERMTIREQTYLSPSSSNVVEISIQLPIFGMKIGDSVEVYAGCAKSIAVCKQVFGNMVHFGGLPEIPSRDVFRLNSFGAYE